MGYRSEVAIKCEENAFEMFKEVCRKVNYLPDKIYKEGNEYILYWDWTKWYEDFDWIQAIISVMDRLDKLNDSKSDKDTGYGYKFLRLGEDDTDIETRENDWNIELWMKREIDIPDGLEEVII